MTKKVSVILRFPLLSETPHKRNQYIAGFLGKLHNISSKIIFINIVCKIDKELPTHTYIRTEKF